LLFLSFFLFFFSNSPSSSPMYEYTVSLSNIVRESHSYINKYIYLSKIVGNTQRSRVTRAAKTPVIQRSVAKEMRAVPLITTSLSLSLSIYKYNP
jgi:hypothetical protein